MGIMSSLVKLDHRKVSLEPSAPRLTSALPLVYRVAVSSKPIEASRANTLEGVVIERTHDVLTFTLNNVDHGNEVTGPMFDAMLAELRAEATRPSARVLRLRARGKVFCTGRERAGRGCRRNP